MRFLSDDGKVFNTKEECDEYEQALKEKEQLDKEAEELKKRNDELRKLEKRYEAILKDLKSLGSDFDTYKKQYPPRLTKDKNKDKKEYEEAVSSPLIDILMDYFS